MSTHPRRNEAQFTRAQKPGAINVPLRTIPSGAVGGQVTAQAVGLVLLDRKDQPLYVNSAAEAILCYPKTLSTEADRRSEIRKKIRSDLLRVGGGSGQATRLVSGRRRYVCRPLLLEPTTTNGNGASTAIVLERSSRRNEGLRTLFKQFNLTPREREAVLLLAGGLTSKEIAQRMNISSHTVKAFLHLTMLKLGVTTRSGIIGKVTSSLL